MNRWNHHFLRARTHTYCVMVFRILLDFDRAQCQAKVRDDIQRVIVELFCIATRAKTC
jgi:hypothetical protein